MEKAVSKIRRLQTCAITRTAIFEADPVLLFGVSTSGWCGYSQDLWDLLRAGRTDLLRLAKFGQYDGGGSVQGLDLNDYYNEGFSTQGLLCFVHYPALLAVFDAYRFKDCYVIPGLELLKEQSSHPAELVSPTLFALVAHLVEICIPARIELFSALTVDVEGGEGDSLPIAACLKLQAEVAKATLHQVDLALSNQAIQELV